MAPLAGAASRPGSPVPYLRTLGWVAGSSTPPVLTDPRPAPVLTDRVDVCRSFAPLPRLKKSMLAVATAPAALVLTGTSRSVGLGKSHIGVYTKLELF